MPHKQMTPRFLTAKCSCSMCGFCVHNGFCMHSHDGCVRIEQNILMKCKSTGRLGRQLIAVDHHSGLTLRRAHNSMVQRLTKHSTSLSNAGSLHVHTLCSDGVQVRQLLHCEASSVVRNAWNTQAQIYMLLRNCNNAMSATLQQC